MSKKKVIPKPRLTIIIDVFESSTKCNISSTDGIINFYEIIGILECKKNDISNKIKNIQP